ncbi:hypothetical protein E4M02_11165 [Brevundimonas sp. S30B]|uniref:tape measure protein n=1 Tax=unclassified Brevundimonas TaxID=2622653 RepID=UPI001071FDCB|nr:MULTISPECIES: tape measure protein [unclassified Brevundimonas]QBX38674.1 hypothetical protein E4M01_13425 [Brevundimonas sp. MF30-B]TFW01265.1 hypothetical protein E4M02_11165 [Brevundimonas sp. S30B]
MARDVEALVLQMTADLRRFEKSMSSMREVADRRLTQVERRAQQSQRNLSRVMDNAGRDMVGSLQRSLGQLAPTLAAAFSTQQIVRYADGWKSMTNQLAAAGVATDDLAGRQDRLLQVANDSRSSVADTVALYARLTIATQEVGLAANDTIRLTELLNKSFQASGKTSQEASSAALQLSQALASGNLAGDELRSLRENAPELAQVIARSMGVGIGALKDLGAEGKITADIIINAILGAGDTIEAKFNSTSVTVGQALTQLNNNLGAFIGRQDESLSASDRLAQAIIWLGENLDTVAQLVGVLAAVMGTRFVLAMTAGSGSMIAQSIAAARLIAFQTAMTASMTGVTRATLISTAAMRTFTASIAANPVGALILAIAALTTGLLALKATTDDVSDALDRSGELLREYKQSADSAADGSQKFGADSAGAVSGVNSLCDATRNLAGETLKLADARLQAARAARLEQIASNRALAQKLRNPGIIQRAAEGAGAISPYTSNVARAVQAGREAAADRLDQMSAELMSQAIAISTSPTARFTTGGGSLNAVGSTDSGGGKKPKGPTGPTPEELAAMREMLRLQGQLDLQRAQGREEEAIATQRQIDLINLTRQYTDAQVENAAEAARAQVAAVATAEDSARGLAILWENNQRAMDALSEASQRENALLLDRLGYEAELARLSGDPRRIEVAERELFIEERINEILRLRPELTAAAARAQATEEADALKSAGISGEMREEFRRSFRDGIRAAIDGDMGGFFENLADRFTDRMLDNLADDLFNLLSQAAKGFASGGGQGGGFLSSLLSSFGRRATGGPVTAGQPYIVGERRAEVFVPSVNGTVLPSVNAAMGRAQRASQQRSELLIRVQPNDDRFDAYVDSRAEPMAYRAAAGAVAVNQSQMRTAQRRVRQRFV